mgnify:CR=1 FL=1
MRGSPCSAQGGGDAATVDVDEGCVQAADSGVFAPHAVEANKDRKKSLGERCVCKMARCGYERTRV